MAVRELSSSPSLKRLYPKAVGGGALALARKLPVGGDGPGELPDEQLVLRDVAVDRERLAEYCRVCTFHIRYFLPTT